ncbi:MAG: DUF4317 domain-containing protein [Clostridia bacterium]|nr:DUF4317 domain-containing protein [Clostridia bacterium]
MTEKELFALRRRFRSDRTGISHICGCFVNTQKEILSEFDQGLGLLAEEDADALLGILKKTMSGSFRRNLIEIEFSTAQVLESKEHALLTTLRSSELGDKEAVHQLYEAIVSTFEAEENYVILLAHDRYDIHDLATDGQETGESTASFPYILCAICSVKSGKAIMSYDMPHQCFRSLYTDTAISAPTVGFMFPILEDRGANIYKALYYTKNLENSQQTMADALFRSTLPMPAKEQKQTFGEILEEAVAEDCSLRVVKAVHNQLCHMIEEHKQEKTEDELLISKDEAGTLLRSCGVEAQRIEQFEQKFEERFGENAQLNPGNLAESKQVRVQTPDVAIRVSPGCSDLVEARVIDGVKYILVRADSDVEVNGIKIQI